VREMKWLVVEGGGRRERGIELCKNRVFFVCDSVVVCGSIWL
jgi:hypothetical protein